MLKKNLAFTCLVFSMAATTANADFVDATDSGWFDDTGFTTSNSFSNYIAGEWIYDPTDFDEEGPERDVLTRNFFVFDLTNVVGTVTSATLSLTTNWNQQPGTYSIWDVESTIPDLRQGPPQFPDAPLKPEVYVDLGSGIAYGDIHQTWYPVPIGSPTFPGVIIDIQLTQAALDSINAKANGNCTPGASQDCLWAIGGKYTTDNPDVNYGFVFGESGLGTRQLTYSTAPAVPIPAAAWLFGSALLGLVGIGRRKKA
jgi:hypothetical protein